MVDIFFYSHRISIPELESSLMDLPYIAEAYVVGAPHYEARELVATLIRLHHGHENSTAKITLAKIRNDLAMTHPSPKFPTLLRILHDNEKVPHTASGKPVKRGLLQKFFCITDFIPSDYVARDVEYWGTRYYQILSRNQPWMVD
jgi:malonyl-CoA/methylmalonyl-CoA synthetase